MMLSKRAIDRGASPWTGTFLGNLWLALIWAGIAVFRGEIVPREAWTDAAIIGVFFVLGQLFTYLAFQFGDVSVATPIFSVKVLMVATLLSLKGDEAVGLRIWIGGAMATMGVVLIQWSDGTARCRSSYRKQAITVALALSAAFSLSLFDVCLQSWSANWNSFAFLPVMFGSAGLLSIVFLPRVDSPKQLRKLKALPWIVAGTLMMAAQAMSMCFSLAQFGDAARINIVYSLRGLWGVVLAWALAGQLQTAEATVATKVMLRRLTGAILLTMAVLLVITA